MPCSGVCAPAICGARVRDLAEHGLLLARGALHGLDQVADQVAAALELVVHLRPLVLDVGLLTDERVASCRPHSRRSASSASTHDRPAPTIPRFIDRFSFHDHARA